jgi:hypothetical protein
MEREPHTRLFAARAVMCWGPLRLRATTPLCRRPPARSAAVCRDLALPFSPAPQPAHPPLGPRVDISPSSSECSDGEAARTPPRRYPRPQKQAMRPDAECCGNEARSPGHRHGLVVRVARVEDREHRAPVGVCGDLHRAAQRSDHISLVDRPAGACSEHEVPGAGRHRSARGTTPRLREFGPAHSDW